jgi:hypothetical protein
MDSFLQESDPADVFLPLAGGTMDDDAVITFDNGSRLKEGTTNAGANGGIAQVCSIDYELKWEAGRLFVMQQDGFTIRVEQYGFTAVPTATDDDTKGYIVGSRRILDSGVAYTCTDNTTDAAVWRLDVSGNASVTVWGYRAETGSITGDPTHGKLIWDNADQISATSINVSHKNQQGDDIEFILGFIKEGQEIFLQDRDVSENYQLWIISGTPTLTDGGTANAYYTYPVTFIASGGTGTTGFADNNQLFLGVTQTLALHASTHAADGDDPITPDSIGAVSAYDSSDLLSIDSENRQLIASDGTTVAVDWSGTYAGVSITGTSGAGANIYSPSGTGVDAQSDSSWGAYIASGSGTGAEIFSDSGIGAKIYSNSNRGVSITSTSGIGAYIYSDSGTGVDAYSSSSRGAFIGSGSGTGAYISSDSGKGAQIETISGSYAADIYNAGSGDGAKIYSDSGTGASISTQTGSEAADIYNDGSGMAARIRGSSGVGASISTQTGVVAADIYNNGSGRGANITSDSGTGAEIYSNSGRGAEIYSTSGIGARIYSDSNRGAEIYSTSSTGAKIYSDSGIGASIDTNSGYAAADIYHAGSGIGANIYSTSGDHLNVGSSLLVVANNGDTTLTGLLIAKAVTVTPNTVAALTGGEGTIAYVNDATTPVIGVAVAGGGSAKCLVCYNGTSWIVTSLL